MDYHPCMEISQGYRGYSNNIKRKQEKKLQTDQSLDIHKTFKDSKSEKKDSNLFFPGFLEYIIKFLDFASIEQLFFVDFTGRKVSPPSKFDLGLLRLGICGEIQRQPHIQSKRVLSYALSGINRGA